MTKAELWAKYVEKNPSFTGDAPVTLTPNGIWKLFSQTWDIASQDAATSVAAEQMFKDLFTKK